MISLLPPMSPSGPEPKWALTAGMSAVEGKPEKGLRRLDRRFWPETFISMGGVSHHLLQKSQSLIGPVMGHKQVIVVKRRNRIHAYSGLRQPRRDRC
jgi:hypothetical protein